MSHRISGFVGRLPALTEAAATLDGERVIPLTGGFGFLPLVERLKEPADPGPFPDLRLRGRFAAWAAEQSRRLPLAYIETEYWAGRGTQGAVVWRDGEVVLGPVVTGNEVPDPPAPSDRAINQAARLLGVKSGQASDEFAALGLERYRSNHDWLTATGGA